MIKPVIEMSCKKAQLLLLAHANNLCFNLNMKYFCCSQIAFMAYKVQLAFQLELFTIIARKIFAVAVKS